MRLAFRETRAAPGVGRFLGSYFQKPALCTNTSCPVRQGGSCRAPPSHPPMEVRGRIWRIWDPPFVKDAHFSPGLRHQPACVRLLQTFCQSWRDPFARGTQLWPEPGLFSGSFLPALRRRSPHTEPGTGASVGPCSWLATEPQRACPCEVCPERWAVVVSTECRAPAFPQDREGGSVCNSRFL